MRENETLFLQDGDVFVPTEAAGNPWGPLTGGGPVAGLLARAAESAIDDPDMFIARLTVDLMRPAPRTDLTLSTRTLRAGKRLQVVETVLHSGDKELARATAQGLRRSDMGEPTRATTPTVPFEGPQGIAKGSLLPPELDLRWGVHDVVDVRWLSNQAGGSPSTVWMRMPLPLLPGEPLTPLIHVAILADCISAASPVGELFGPWINTDISLYLHREFTGDWLGMQIERDVEATGIGVARARLFDEHGPIGIANEAVLANQLG